MENQTDKVMSLEEAIAAKVKDGDHISIGGATANRNPVAATYEIIRQKRRNLHLYGHISGTGPDLLIGAGCVASVEGGYFGIGRFAPTSVCFQRAVERGGLLVEDYSNLQMALRFLAGALGIPFIPTYAGIGSDLAQHWGIDAEERKRNPRLASLKLLEMANPFDRSDSPENVLLLPAINPDVTIAHVQKADRKGNARIEGLTFADLEQIKSARNVILTCEEIVETEQLKDNPDLNQIPSFYVDCVVHAPYGAHPTQCFNYYDYDADFLYTLRDVSKEENTFQQFLETYVFGVPDFHAYLKKIGKDKLDSIKADPEYGYNRKLNRKAG